MRANRIPAFVSLVLMVSLLSLPLVVAAQQPEPTPPPAQEQAPPPEPPPSGDAVAESRTTSDGSSTVTTWYANPTWIAIGAVAVVAVALLIAFAARNPDRPTTERTTVVKSINT
jgi:hypothetical protein